jgi:hypothetical protein
MANKLATYVTTEDGGYEEHETVRVAAPPYARLLIEEQARGVVDVERMARAYRVVVPGLNAPADWAPSQAVRPLASFSRRSPGRPNE